MPKIVQMGSELIDSKVKREIIDISPLVETINFEAKTYFKFPEGDIFRHEFSFTTPPLQQNIELTINDPVKADILATVGRGWKITMTGRYWFDRKAEAIVQSEEYNIDGNLVRANVTGSDWKDLTDYSVLARFLRWVLRRN